MEYTRHKLPIVDEDGISTLATLEDHDFGLTTTTPALDQNAANADHLVFAGMGVPSECCDIPVTPTAAVHEQEPDMFPGERQSYPSPRPTPIDIPCFVFPAAERQPAQTVQENPHTSLNARAPAFVPAPAMEGNRGHATHPLVFHNTTPALIEDQLRARATSAASLARHVLQTLGELGPARFQNDFTYPLTGPDTFPESSLVFVQEHTYNPGMGRGAPTQARGGRNPSVASSRGSTLSATTQQSTAASVVCRYVPCRRNGKPFPAAGERNKHERHVHGAKKDRPHACDICGDRFNYPNEVHRHADAVHFNVPATEVCWLCTSSFKHRPDHLDRHLKDSHPEKWPAIREAREAEKRSVSSSRVAGPMTPPTASVSTSSNGFGLLTPPSSQRNYQSEFPRLPTSQSRT